MDGPFDGMQSKRRRRPQNFDLTAYEPAAALALQVDPVPSKSSSCNTTDSRTPMQHDPSMHTHVHGATIEDGADFEFQRLPSPVDDKPDDGAGAAARRAPKVNRTGTAGVVTCIPL